MISGSRKDRAISKLGKELEKLKSKIDSSFPYDTKEMLELYDKYDICMKGYKKFVRKRKIEKINEI